MVNDRVELILGGSLGRALLAGIIGFDDFAVLAGVGLDARLEAVMPNLALLATCTEQIPLLAALQRNPLGFGFSGDHHEWDQRLSGTSESLRPIAEALVACPATQDWWRPLDQEQQRWLRCHHGPEQLPRGEAIEQALSRWIDEEIAAQSDRQSLAFYKASLGKENFSGKWWSSPIGQGIVNTSPACRGELPCIGLATMEDPLGPETYEVWTVEVRPGVRVHEVDGPYSWARLVDQAPIDITVTRDADWSRWTTKHGPWLVPDWRIIGENYDAVHVSIGGYLATRGSAIEVEGGYTFLAGWDAGATLWLRDSFGEIRYEGEWTGQPGQDGLPEAFRL